MKKNDLKLGQVVELANTQRYLITSVNNITYLIDNGGYMKLNDYEEDLTKKSNDNYSITKVFNIKEGMLGRGINAIFHNDCLRLVWAKAPKKKTRLEVNREILSLLSELIEQHPNWRFHQFLYNPNTEKTDKDKFFEESIDTLNSLKHELAD